LATLGNAAKIALNTVPLSDSRRTAGVDMPKKFPVRGTNGVVVIEEIPRAQWPQMKAESLIQSIHLYTWQPPYAVGCQLPNGFALRLECLSYKSGFRLFLPTVSYRALVHEASLAGHSMLSDRGKIKTNCEFSFHEARLFNQFSRHTRDYLGTTIKLGRVLQISRAGRPDSGTKDILPEDVGLKASGTGRRWSVGQLKKEGLRSALDFGIVRPTPDQIAEYGLWQAAKLDPLAATAKEATSLVRMALYATGPENVKVGRAANQYVAKQIRASLHDHLSDSTAEFDRWITDPKANLLNRISKRADCEYSVEEVRAAMLELGWQSFELLAMSSAEALKAFAAAMPQPLSRAEQTIYADMYLARRNIGGVPLAVLHDRLGFLQPAIQDIWAHPEERDRLIGVYMRMLNYYSELISNRRAGDRIYKRSSAGRNESNRPTIETPFDPHSADEGFSKAAPSEFFREIGLLAAARKGIPCDSGSPSWDVRLISSDEKFLNLEVTSTNCGFIKELRLSRKELEKLAREVRDAA
jgi:hypothetical protein